MKDTAVKLAKGVGMEGGERGWEGEEGMGPLSAPSLSRPLCRGSLLGNTAQLLVLGRCFVYFLGRRVRDPSVYGSVHFSTVLKLC